MGMGQSEYEVSIPHSGHAEQKPEDWWKAVCLATRLALKAVPDGPVRIGGVAVSSQAPTLLPVDKDGQPLRPAMIWMDRRAEKEAQTLKEAFGDGIIEKVSGNQADPFYVASKIRWFKLHEPDKFKLTSAFLQANGYINYRLTEKLSMDKVHAALLQLRNYEKDEWSEEICHWCGVDPGKFPPIYQGHEIIGEVTREASAVTGLLPGTPVMAGTVDGSAAALEAGAVKQGIVGEMTGTSTVLFMPNDSGIIEPAFIAMPHALPKLHLLLAALVSTGACLKWFRDQLGTKEVELSEATGNSPYDLLTGLAGKSDPGSGGLIFLPYMMGERSPVWNTHARGVFFGLSLSTSKGDLIRAILEGTSYALYHNIELARASGLDIHEIRSVGGGSKSRFWNQLKADVLGIPVLVPEAAIGAPFGDALLVGMGLGHYKDISDSLNQMVKIRERYEPDALNHQSYLEGYAVYKSLSENMTNDFDLLASITGK
jgi:xylulokinase